MSVDQLMEKYQKIITAPIDFPSPSFNESEESVEILLQTNSLRILLIRKSVNPQTVTLEVEVWLPNHNSNKLTGDQKAKGNKSEDEDLSSALSSMIDHLQYLLQLYKSGFTLDVIKHDCLWTASHSFTEIPSREIFELLIPP